jgi:hypothetical protein
MFTRHHFNFYFQREHLCFRKDVVVPVLLLATGSFAAPETGRVENWSRRLTGWAFIDTHPPQHTTYPWLHL